LQFRVFRFCRAENGDTGVGFFPQGEKLLVSSASLGGVALQCIGAGQAEAGEAYSRALELATNRIEQAYLRRRRKALETEQTQDA
jgi:hypothetical protein